MESASGRLTVTRLETAGPCVLVSGSSGVQSVTAGGYAGGGGGCQHRHSPEDDGGESAADLD